MADKSHKKVLIVEDDDFLQNMLNIKLSKEGFNTKTASDGIEAFEVLEDFHPDLIILDLVMPRKNGFEVLEDLKLNKKLSKIPVIVFTNLAQDSDKERVAEYDVMEYLIKADTPIQSLVDKVEEVCSGKDCKK